MLSDFRDRSTARALIAGMLLSSILAVRAPGGQIWDAEFNTAGGFDGTRRGSVARDV